MSRHASSTFVVRRWDDEPYERIAEAGAGGGGGGARLSRVSVTNVFEGDIEGEGRLEYVMAVPDGESASFAGIQRIAGSVGGLRGSLVLQTVGTFGGGVIQGTWSVVPGMGTGELAGLRGQGMVLSHGDGRAEVTLEYEVGAVTAAAG